MPKKSTTYAEHLDWPIAETLFGLAAIRRVAGGASSLSNYRRDGVPSHAVVKLLRARGEGELGPVVEIDPYASATPEVRALHGVLDACLERIAPNVIDGVLRALMVPPHKSGRARPVEVRAAGR